MALSSCSLVQQQAQPADSESALPADKPKKKTAAPKNDQTAQPTPAQMEAAVQVLQENATAAAETAAVADAIVTEATPAAESVSQPDVIPGGLRMGRFAPPEEAASSSDSDMPAPNSVELHGFRSPNLKGGTLPMNINGKINKSE